MITTSLSEKNKVYQRKTKYIREKQSFTEKNKVLQRKTKSIREN